MISFIMPAKNVSSYAEDAVDALLQADYEDWELVVIEDHSTDDTLNILREIAKKDSRVKVFENIGSGKVAGQNYGYTLINGEIVKCIDADDLIDVKFFDYLDVMMHYDAVCHDGYVTTSDLQIIGNYSIDQSILHKDFAHCLKYLKSLPKWAWSFTREIGDKIFPMPEDLPFEDIWFSLVIKRYADKIDYVNKPLYYYRQHNNQTYGGILNFDSEVVSFRARRMLKLIDVIEHEQTKRLIRGLESDYFFRDIRSFYRLLADGQLKLWDILNADIPIKLRSKLFVYRKLGFLAPAIVRFKWRLDRL